MFVSLRIRTVLRNYHLVTNIKRYGNQDKKKRPKYFVSHSTYARMHCVNTILRNSFGIFIYSNKIWNLGSLSKCCEPNRMFFLKEK